MSDKLDQLLAQETVTITSWPRLCRLELTPERLRQKHYFIQNDDYAWGEVSEFRIWRQKKYGFTYAATVVFDAEKFEKISKTLAKVTRAMAGGNAVINGNFGLKAEDLALLLNTYRERALAARSDEPSDPSP